MTIARHGEPRDLPKILEIWADQLPRDWIGYDRMAKYVLSDPLIGLDSWWVVVASDQVIGFMVVSRPVNKMVHVGAVAVRRQWQHQGFGRLLWDTVRDDLYQRGTQFVKFDGIFPHIFIPGVDRQTYPAAFQWLVDEGLVQLNAVVAMQKPLHQEPILDVAAEDVWRHSGVMIGKIPESLRGQAIWVAEKQFGSGWARALRETWLEGREPERVLGLFTHDEVLGVSVVGGYGQPIGRLGPIGVVKELRGQGMGVRLLDYTLAYMHTYNAPMAYFLHCDVGIPAYTMYLNRGFHITRTFVPFSMDLTRAVSDH